MFLDETGYAAKADVTTALLAGFPAWVALQPSDCTYSYNDYRNCALAQYLRTVTNRPVSVGGYEFYLGDDTHSLPDRLADDLNTEPFTFGALAARLAA